MNERCIRFAPSKVEGLPDVSEIAIHPDRIELLSAEKWVVVWFVDIARWPRPAAVWKALSRFGWRPRWLPVADRDWFHPPHDRFFAFYTRPKIVVFLVDEDRGIGYGETLFRQVQDVIESGGFNTFDLG